MITEKNPVGLKAIDHLEFCVDSFNSPTLPLFTKLGFHITHQSKDKKLYTQGQIRFLINAEQAGRARDYLNQHEEGVSKISFLVDDVAKSLEAALSRGAQLVEDIQLKETADGVIKTAAIQGFGDVLNEFVQRPHISVRPGLDKVAEDTSSNPLQTRVSRIDHFTNNVPKGEMEKWVEFYKRVYGFVETRYFDIKGVKTGLNSKVVQLEDNSIIIPINEPEVENGKSQIQEFLDRHQGPGVQHIALMTPDIISTVGELRQREVKFLDVPDTYYEDLPKRPFHVTEEIDTLKSLKLLADGDEQGYLLQIFSDTYIGPLFFEYIQRKGHWGFGEGNFQALFDAIERDQIKRGYLK